MHCIYAQGYVHALQSIREYLLHKIFYAVILKTEKKYYLVLNKRMQFKVKKTFTNILFGTIF